MASFNDFWGGSGGVPIGAIVPGQFADRPGEYLPCDGASYLKSAYPKLDKTGLETLGTNQLVQRTMPASAKWSQIAGVPGGVLIANTSATAAMARSLDGGTTWTTCPMPAGGLQPLISSIAYLNGEFFVPHFNQAIIYKSSDNGLTWTPQTSPGVTKNIAAIGNNLIIDNDATTGNLYRSSTGTTGSWITISIPSLSYLSVYTSMVSRNGTLVINVKNPAEILVTKDGIDWGVIPAPDIISGYVTPFSKDRYFWDYYVCESSVVIATATGAKMADQYASTTISNYGRVANVDSGSVKIEKVYALSSISLGSDAAGKLAVSYSGADNWQSVLLTPFNIAVPGTQWFQHTYYTESGNRGFFTTGSVSSTIATLDIDTAKFRTPVRPGFFIKAA